MIKHWNFEIYILLDTKQIEYLFKHSKQCHDSMVKDIAERISKKIYDFKASLIRHHIEKGYAKILN